MGHAAIRERLGPTLAARQIAMDLGLARARAVARNREQRLRFQVGGTTYRMQERGPSGFVDVDGAGQLPETTRIDNCTAPDDAISFRPQGGAGSFGSVTVGNAAGQQRAVIVAITGRTRIQ
jgi:Tfp pilus assembly protein FimT